MGLWGPSAGAGSGEDGSWEKWCFWLRRTAAAAWRRRVGVRFEVVVLVKKKLTGGFHAVEMAGEER